MDKKQFNELKDKAIKATKEELSNMKSAGLDIKEAVKNKNFDNIKKKDAKSKKKFYFGIGGFIVILLVVFYFLGSDDDGGSGGLFSSSCEGRYYFYDYDGNKHCSNSCAKGFINGNYQSKCYYTDEDGDVRTYIGDYNEN